MRILIAVGPVELTDSLVIGEADADFSGELHLLISQNRIAAPLDKQPRPGRDFGLFLPVCDINLCTCQWTSLHFLSVFMIPTAPVRACADGWDGRNTFRRL